MLSEGNSYQNHLNPKKPSVLPSVFYDTGMLTGTDVLVSWDCRNKLHKRGGLNTTEMYCLAALEVGRPKSSDGMLPPSEPCKSILSCLFLATGGLLTIRGVPWFQLQHVNLCLCSHMAFSPHVSVSLCFFSSSPKDTSHWIKAHCTPKALIFN